MRLTRVMPLLVPAIITLCACFCPSVLDAQVLRLPPRPPGALSGSEFGASITSLPRAAREEQIARQVLGGNVPDFLRSLVPVQVTGLVGGLQKTAQVYVTPDYVAVGSDSDYFLIPMSPLIAQRIADSTGCLLPTKKIVDAVYLAAPLKLAPKPIAPSGAMITVPVFLAHNDSVKQQRLPVLSQFPRGTLVGGTKKDVIISNKIYNSLKPNVPKPVVIYGWHQLSGVPIQPVYNGHEETYADYSHGIRLVQDTLTVDGAASTAKAILTDSQLCTLLSDEGVISVPRYTYVLPTGVRDNGSEGMGKTDMEVFPNPFNPRTVVSCHLQAGQAGWPVAGGVKLVVYDVAGREVVQLFDGDAAEGSFTTTLDGSSLASGIYICRLSAGGVVLSRRIALVR